MFYERISKYWLMANWMIQKKTSMKIVIQIQPFVLIYFIKRHLNLLVMLVIWFRFYCIAQIAKELCNEWWHIIQLAEWPSQ